MSWNPTEKEVSAILALQGSRRYEYFIKKAADEGQVWGLHDGKGWAVAADGDGREHVPLWPHSSYAALCMIGPWAAFAPKPLELDVWLSRWVPGLKRDSRRVAVFPTPASSGISMDPEHLANHLQEELKRYE